ncbi:probable polygalacturonase At1g80170 isoform X2 [Henckelia pumila]|uniref:probable polygalacturonase At1g80170 isoform X2 n=1 Tax=Henckelia pumila TaxID=405737 RepID=UPI003C6E5220
MASVFDSLIYMFSAGSSFLDMYILLLLIVALGSSHAGCKFDCKDEYHFSVTDYGAKGDGQTDDSIAFLETWDAACTASTPSSRFIVPPNNTYLLNPIIFQGTIIGPELPSEWDGKDASGWLGFKDVNGLIVDGFGTVDGRGQGWWDQSCRYHPQLQHCTTLAPTALNFMSCNKSIVSNLRLVNSAQTHLLMMGCDSFVVNNVVIESPANSPNTDGIHIHSARNVIITNSKFSTGDDCISIGDRISDIKIDNVVCGPGHGISIGSLGKRGNYVQVERIHISDALFKGTTNGARIKTWQVGRGYVRDVTFENLMFDSVQNPMIIDQNYCDVRNTCKEEETGVEISNVRYKEIHGTSSSEIAINLKCSNSVPCYGIWMESIELKSTIIGEDVVADCANAHGQELDVFPAPCLLN